MIWILEGEGLYMN